MSCAKNALIEAPDGLGDLLKCRHRRDAVAVERLWAQSKTQAIRFSFLFCAINEMVLKLRIHPPARHSNRESVKE
ncbi:hypothetical protein CDAR_56671 [Caerostris darwini]|uniref:Uncharacterized protein n=1 Tax=Caerostris darwini TaxID=1538125 RepID=A0AAV4PVB5_9ARAC|nr:hypothetical protein CDAR_56671 [Caerostris darwini]